MIIFDIATVLAILIAICGTVIFFTWSLTDRGDLARKVTASILGVAVLVVLFLTFWYFTSTESGQRRIKTQQSELNGGILREVKVYSVDGKLVQEYEGKFDIEYDDDRILFDDENELRHIIYYPTGTVIIDEISE